MSEWWTYQLSDFLMFSPQIYWRLVERYNRDVWPLQLLALGAGVALLGLARAPRAGMQRVTAAVLAAAWLWTAWAFHWQRYSAINWAAEYLAAACGVQGALLLVFAVFGVRRDALPAGLLSRRAGWVLVACAVVLYPLAGLAFGRPIVQAEVFGLMPDPTALATLGSLLAWGTRLRYGLAVIPALSLVLGLLTLYVMAQ